MIHKKSSTLMRATLSLFFIIVLFQAGAATSYGLTVLESLQSHSCSRTITELGRRARIPLRSQPTFKVLVWNVEELRISDERLDPFKKKWPKSEAQIQQIIATIEREKPDVVLLQEVANRETLWRLISRINKVRYRFFYEPGNTVGMDVAQLVRADLMMDVAFESHKKESIYNPGRGKEVNVFTRDLPALLLMEPGQDHPFLITMNNHATATHLDYRKDESETQQAYDNRIARGTYRTEEKRAIQNRTIVQIDKRYAREFGEDTHRLLAGDFNANMQERPHETSWLWTRFQDSFDLVGVPPADRFTHVWFHGHERSLQQMDGALVSPSLASAVRQVRILRDQPAPTGPDQMREMPSDHYGFIIEFDTNKLLSRHGL